MAEMHKLLRQAWQMSKELRKHQKTLAQREVEVEVGGGAVRIRLNCKPEALRISLGEEFGTPETRRVLEDLLLSALNEGLRRTHEANEEEARRAATQLGLGQLGEAGEQP